LITKKTVILKSNVKALNDMPELHAPSVSSEFQTL